MSVPADDEHDPDLIITNALMACEARVTELERVLRMVEWVGEFRNRQQLTDDCPWCKRYHFQGHAPDCPRQAALGKQEEP